ncbi:DUF2971 domain-containing protein [Arthrobacter sp. fls2-241-R2A-172]|uniref:DUF2971 domain-containing protein n=1 Tax=Arthrobacter sp. fls2-241-R2A-172 TaxID=3040325 RepID=UPI00254F2842|nr:DUF2971 domain-containing protein [Arthrobacter sp. fls2-241-R2A-172]
MTFLPTQIEEEPATGEVFHYTSADVAISNILATGTLRLSPMHSTNDPWESEPIYTGFSLVDPEDEKQFDGDRFRAATKEIDHHIRLRSKVLCLTRDWGQGLPRFEGERRGWRHLSSWAHYGGGHAGVCMGFDLEKLHEAFEKVGGSDDLRVSGPISYWRGPRAPFLDSIDTSHLIRYGTDAVARHYAEVFKKQIFLSKHADWSAEYEYRFALMNQSTLPEYIDISDALTCVFLGHSFPDWKLPSLHEALSKFGNIDINRMRYHNRTVQALPPGEPEVAGTAFPPTEGGSLMERVDALAGEAKYHVQ